jgi:hypothetical protein
MTNTVASVPTVGERLDALIDTIDSLPSTHLYGAVVAVSVVFSFALLNWGGPSNHTREDAPQKRRLSWEMRRSAASASAVSKSGETEPQPKWHILRVLNYAAVGSFAASVVIFCRGASVYLNDPATLLQFLVGWSLFLCYFFGFFGISFVDPDGMMMSYDPQQSQANNDPQDSTNCKSRYVSYSWIPFVGLIYVILPTNMYQKGILKTKCIIAFCSMATTPLGRSMVTTMAENYTACLPPCACLRCWYCTVMRRIKIP